ncbi:hypothetical protein THAR02_07279 [Trichoderma harzianum]|uniref:Uncharacterized protein n=1 Tax=Trichoderma harzianum TaxID=5544 RepID=A0A0F9XJH2_TRIHA|nr:hypothetical protein THAR02_07279 [Trichoderma harzianum]
MASSENGGKKCHQVSPPIHPVLDTEETVLVGGLVERGNKHLVSPPSPRSLLRADAAHQVSPANQSCKGTRTDGALEARGHKKPLRCRRRRSLLPHKSHPSRALPVKRRSAWVRRRGPKVYWDPPCS